MQGYAELYRSHMERAVELRRRGQSAEAEIHTLLALGVNAAAGRQFRPGSRVRWTVYGCDYTGTVERVAGPGCAFYRAGDLIVRPDRQRYRGQTVPVIAATATLLLRNPHGLTLVA